MGSHFWFAPSYANLERTQPVVTTLVTTGSYQCERLPGTGFHCGFQGFVVVSTDNLASRAQSPQKTARRIITSRPTHLRDGYSAMLNHHFEMVDRTMGWNDHVDWELDDAINDLIDERLLEEGTPAYGVAQQVIHSGIESLSSEQRRVWEKYVWEPLGRRQEKLEIQRIIDSNPE